MSKGKEYGKLTLEITYKKDYGVPMLLLDLLRNETNSLLKIVGIKRVEVLTNK